MTTRIDGGPSSFVIQVSGVAKMSHMLSVNSQSAKNSKSAKSSVNTNTFYSFTFTFFYLQNAQCSKHTHEEE